MKTKTNLFDEAMNLDAMGATVMHRNPNERGRIFEDSNIVKLAKEVYGPMYVEEYLYKRLKSSAVKTEVAYDKRGELHGFLCYKEFKHTIHVIEFMVRPDSRRSRVATKLIRTVIDRLDGKTFEEIRVEVVESNLNVQLFLRAMGFKAIKTLKNPEGEDVYLFIMRENMKKL